MSARVGGRVGVWVGVGGAPPPFPPLLLLICPGAVQAALSDTSPLPPTRLPVCPPARLHAAGAGHRAVLRQLLGGAVARTGREPLPALEGAAIDLSIYEEPGECSFGGPPFLKFPLKFPLYRFPVLLPCPAFLYRPAPALHAELSFRAPGTALRMPTLAFARRPRRRPRPSSHAACRRAPPARSAARRASCQCDCPG